MKTLDDILDQFADPQPPPLLIFSCPQDGYDIYYAPELDEGTYRLYNSGDELRVSLTRPQVAYYLKTGYWIEVS